MAQQIPGRFIEIGRIGKARGLDGTIRFMPCQQFIDDFLSEAAILYIRNERSDLVPLRVVKVHKEIKRNQQSFFVKFDMIASREQADSARDKAIFADKNTLDVDILLSDEPETDYFGYNLIFQGRVFGEVLDVMENPAHPILEVKTPSGRLLIPFVDEFVESVDHQKQQLLCKELDQLTDL